MFDFKRLLLFEQQQSYTDFVKEAQRKLMSLGYDLGPRKDDGIIGPRTRRALSDFQLKNGGNGKGNLGPFTAKKLGIEYVAKGQSSKPGTVPDGKQKPDGKTDTKNQSCGKFEIFPSVSDTLSKVCAGQTTGVAKGPDGCSEYVRQKTGKWQGNAWHAYKTKGYPSVSGFKSLFANKSNLDSMANIFQKINSQSSGISASGINSSGTHSNIKSLMSAAIPSQSSFKGLNTGDVVGIYYPPSGYHEKAFHAAGKPYFVKDSKGQWQKGNTIKRGEGFGMNTHVGIVAFQKDGVPLVVHNIGGTVYSDPYNALKGGGKIMWIRRP